MAFGLGALGSNVSGQITNPGQAFQQNPLGALHSFVDPRRNTLLALAAGLAQGPGLAYGIGNAFQNAAQYGAPADQLVATQAQEKQERQQQLNATAAWARRQFPALADAPPEVASDLAPKLYEAQLKGQIGSDNAPANVQEWMYFSKLSPEDQSRYLVMKRSNPYLDIGTGFVQPNPVSPGTPAGPAIQKDNAGAAFETAVGKGQGEDVFAQRAAAMDAQQSLQATQSARDLLDKGVITGFGADFKVGFGKALQSVGFNVAPDAIANSEAFVATRAQEVGRLIKLFGAGTGLSDADREFATKAAAGTIELNEASIRKILDINERAAQNVIARYNEMITPIQQNGGRPSLALPGGQGGQAAPQSGGTDYKTKYGLE